MTDAHAAALIGEVTRTQATGDPAGEVSSFRSGQSKNVCTKWFLRNSFVFLNVLADFEKIQCANFDDNKNIQKGRYQIRKTKYDEPAVKDLSESLKLDGIDLCMIASPELVWDR